MQHNDELLISWQDIQRDSLLLAEKVKEHAHDSAIYAVSRGGLIPASLVAYTLDIRHIDTICVKSYDNRVQDNIDIIKHPQRSDHSKVLIIDDISDSGRTARMIKKIFPEALYISLYVKKAGKDKVAHYIKEFPDNLWINFPWD